MGENVIIWTMDNCIVCEGVKEHFKLKGMDFEERSCQDLVNGKESNLKAIRQFVKQKQSAPVVYIGSSCVDPKSLIS